MPVAVVMGNHCHEWDQHQHPWKGSSFIMGHTVNKVTKPAKTGPWTQGFS